MRPARVRWPAERGAGLPLFMVLLVVLSVLAAGAISINRMVSIRSDLQNAAEAVALQAAYRLERFGLPTNSTADLAPALSLVRENSLRPAQVHWVGWGDLGRAPSRHAFVEIELSAPMDSTSHFLEVLPLQTLVRTRARAQMDEDVFQPHDLHCLYSTFFGRPLGCRVPLTRAVRDPFQLSPHVFRRDGGGRETRLALIDFYQNNAYIAPQGCEFFVALQDHSCATRSNDKVVIRYNRPILELPRSGPGGAPVAVAQRGH